MKLLTYLIYTLLITCMFACGGSRHKTKPEFIRERIEKRDSMKALHPDTVIKYREIRWEEKKLKSTRNLIA